jgi:DNA recombination protein RmuC
MDFLLLYQNELAASAGGLIAGFAVMALWMKVRHKRELAQTLHDHQLHVQSIEAELHQMDEAKDLDAAQIKTLHGQVMGYEQQVKYLELEQQRGVELAQKLESSEQHLAEARAQLREQHASFDAQLHASRDKLQLLEQAETILKQQFEQIANQLFETKTAKVDQQNKQSLAALLGPLSVQIESFKKQFNDGVQAEAKERHTLTHEITKLQQLNSQMAQEALNLTNALKGDNKQQGNWGEVVLARVLAESGLREGHEYHTQVSLQDEAGKRLQPDVVVSLPGDKQVIIDSKMALVAFERYFNAEQEAQKSVALSEHIQALRAHIKGLSRKDYHKLSGVKSLDYVLMFIPVEPAFQLAVEKDPSLVAYAMEHNILLVSPTTLLVALRTIDNLWRNERQNQNAALIAEKASKLYDKLRLFVDDMEGVGAALDRAKAQHEGAMNKLATGRGNVIRQAESFKELGVEAKRPISPKLSELAQNELSLQRQAPEDTVN